MYAITKNIINDKYISILLLLYFICIFSCMDIVNLYYKKCQKTRYSFMGAKFPLLLIKNIKL